MNKLLIALTIVVASSASYAQTTTAVKESGKAVAEKALEGKETVQAAATSEPKKSNAQGQGAGAQGQGEDARPERQGRRRQDRQIRQLQVRSDGRCAVGRRPRLLSS